MQRTVVPQARVVGTLALPGDKSITHRSLLLGALAEGTTRIGAPLAAQDTLTTVRVLRRLGVAIDGPPLDAATLGRSCVADVDAPAQAPNTWTVTGCGAGAFAEADPTRAAPVLDCGNSGTTLRLLAGALLARNAPATLVGDASLMRRPMARLLAPLRALGGNITCAPDGRAPLVVRAAARFLHGAEVTLQVASAQLKSAVLLAALGARGTTVVRGRTDSRDHTERLLRHFGATLDERCGVLTLHGPQALHGAALQVPADPSTAAFFWAAAAMAEEGAVCTPNVSLNVTRTAFLRLLARMGARVRVVPAPGGGPEPRGTVTVAGAPLVGCEVGPGDVPGLIDELPLLAVLAQAARGRTTVRGAAELRHKESDRLAAMRHNLHALGGSLRELPDGFDVEGGAQLRGATLPSFDDHRVAMASAVAALRARGASTVLDADCVAVSFPQFFATLAQLTAPTARVPSLPDAPPFF